MSMNPDIDALRKATAQANAAADRLAKADWEESKHPRDKGRFAAAASDRANELSGKAYSDKGTADDHVNATEAHADAAQAHADAAQAAQVAGDPAAATQHADQALEHSLMAGDHASTLDSEHGSDAWETATAYEDAGRAEEAAGSVDHMMTVEKAEWDESKHPRDKGRFTSGGASAESTDRPPTRSSIHVAQDMQAVLGLVPASLDRKDG